MFFSAKTTCKTILRFSPCLDKETLKKQFHVMLVQIHSPEAFKLGLKSRWCEEFVSYWPAKPGAALAATIHGASSFLGHTLASDKSGVRVVKSSEGGFRVNRAAL